MKITLVTETFLPSKDGVVTRLCNTIRWLTDHGHEVCVISPELGVTEYEKAAVKGVKAHAFFLYPSLKLALPSRKVGKLIKAFDPDVVHVVNPAVLGVAGVYYSKRLRYPLVCSYHTNVPKYADFYHLPFLKPILWWFFRTLHNRAILNLCTSATVQAQLAGKRFRNVQLWERGVDVGLYNPKHYDAGVRRRLTNGKDGKILLLYVGRLAAEKEIERIRGVLDASSDYCLAIVGDGPHRAYLEHYFAGTDTVFTGFMFGEDLARAYASADVFVFPSTTETLGLVLLEAMVSGLPVVAARSGPTCEQVREGVEGYLYDADDPHSLTAAILRMKDEAKRREMGRNAYEASGKMGWSKPSEQLLCYYEEVLQSSKQ